MGGGVQEQMEHWLGRSREHRDAFPQPLPASAHTAGYPTRRDHSSLRHGHCAVPGVPPGLPCFQKAKAKVSLASDLVFTCSYFWAWCYVPWAIAAPLSASVVKQGLSTTQPMY